MLMRDFHVHGVELKGLFLAQLPQRLARLSGRGDRLHREGWDINTLYLLADDAAALATACRDLDAGDLADCLEALSTTVQPLFDPPRVPDSALAARIASLLRELREKPLPAAAQSTVPHPAGVVVPGAAQDQGFPLLVIPPSEYWLRFAATSARAPLTEHDAEPIVGEMPKPTAPIVPPPETSATPAPDEATSAAAPARATGPTHKTAYHLGRAEPPAADIDRYLASQGYEVNTFDSVEELKEMLVALPPHVVVVDAAFESALDEIGALVKRARHEVSERLWLIALSGDSDLPTRLRAVRAGCDAFITLPASAGDVIVRIGELIETERSNPYRIMIVEDDRSQTLFAESILRKAGMETLAINEGFSALDELDRFRPELILMDLYMPDVDGMELTALIREREAFISTPIVFLSGEHDADKHFEALNAGGDDFLSKPIRPKHLISAVTNRVRRARQMSARQTAPAQAAAPAADGTVSRDALLQRLAECLAMEDAHTRAGGLLVFEIEEAPALRARLGEARCERLFAEIGSFLAAHAGNRDLVARDGASGFLLLNSDREHGVLETYAADIRDRLSRETFAAAEGAARLLLDAGVCPFRDSGGDAVSMLNAAKAAVGAARADGRHGVFLVRDPSTTNDAELARQIRFALDGAGLQILFQPIVSLHGEEHEQFQALLRLRGDDGRQYVAAELVPVAERAGLIAEIDRWVFAQCVAMIVERSASGRAPRLFLSQSLDSVRDAERIEWMRELLEKHQVRGDSVSLEVTVANAKTALEDVARYGEAIKALGLTLTLSGFEAGTMGERLLNSLPVDLIKLSPRYVRVDDEAVRKELRDLVVLAHERGMQVIAPRVEDARGAAALWSAGVDFIQGNFVQRAAHDLAFDFHASVM